MDKVTEAKEALEKAKRINYLFHQVKWNGFGLTHDEANFVMDYINELLVERVPHALPQHDAGRV